MDGGLAKDEYIVAARTHDPQLLQKPINRVILKSFRGGTGHDDATAAHSNHSARVESSRVM